ncbi:methionine-rich copper-binding protein CopC [Curtobacterium sp. 320]|uniref:copper resistance CopC family protein n=1 Tax=Curtobacterium sp. 320 TaxID=2817749 RepID=UPI002858F49B|nr:copper resistance protein CopC [Curtobacterium sp. 320]MDR6573459.1 methionine-rich copper-binding protein CopC [Curtobacterium sp. 320]
MPFRALLATAASAVALAFVLVTAAPASAHDVLASTAPAADTTVGGDLDQVTLTFSEPPLAGLESGIVVSVTGPDGAEVGAGSVDVDGSTLRTAADLTAAGSYTVTWRSVSVDGHPISGSYRFTSTGAPTTTPTPTATGPTETPSAGTPTPSATAGAGAGATSATAGSSGPGATPWVLGGIAVVVAAALVAVLLVARRRTTPDDD